MLVDAAWMASPIVSLVGASLAPIARTLTSGRARILAYHRFARNDGPRSTGVDTFRRQLRHLKAHCTPMRLDRFIERQLAGEPLPPRPAILTVDDGYRDFVELAYPVLMEEGFPATIFVVTDFAEGQRWLWFDQLRFVIHAAARGAVTVVVAQEPIEMELGSPESRERAWDRVATACLRLSPAVRDETIARITRDLRVDLPSRPPGPFAAASWDELRALDSALVEIGSHTRTHAILSHCDDPTLAAEIEQSRVLAEMALRRPVTSFCYPNGTAADYDARAVAAVQRAGYSCAAVLDGRLAPRGVAASRHLLPRFGANSDPRVFANEVAGVTELKACLLGSMRSEARVGPPATAFGSR